MKQTVLIVDDFENTTWVIKNAIQNNNYEIFTASNGAEALNYFDNRPIDLLITDLNMPVVNGLELIHKVKEIPVYAHMPIILLTTERNIEKLKQVEKAKITAIVNKPFQLDKFKKIVTKCLTQTMR
jgi:two-component system chemotaxis response regulator CheY